MGVFSQLAAWGCSIEWEKVPRDVQRRVLLRHLSTAACCSLPPQAWADEQTRTQQKSALNALQETHYDDFSWLGHRLYSSVVGTWVAGGAEQDFKQALLATLVADEISLRLELSGRLHGNHSSRRLTAMGAAIAHAMSRRCTPAELTAAMHCDGSTAEPFWSGIQRATAPDADPVPFDPSGTLPVSLTQLQNVWLSRFVTFRLIHGPVWAQSALQAVREILRRHNRAAGRPFRADQILHIHLHLDHWTARAAHQEKMLLNTSMERLIRAETTPVQKGYTPDTGPRCNIQVKTEFRLTLRRTQFDRQIFGGFLEELSPPQRVRRIAQHTRALIHTVPTVKGAAQTLAQRPWKQVGPLAPLPYSPATLAQRRIHLCKPADVYVHSSQGERRVERRDVVEGGPEYCLNDLEQAVAHKFTSSAPQGLTLQQALHFVHQAPALHTDAALKLLGAL
jgi:hypothetical protein